MATASASIVLRNIRSCAAASCRTPNSNLNWMKDIAVKSKELEDSKDLTIAREE